MREIENHSSLFCDGCMMFILRLVNRIVVQRAILKQEVFITSIDFKLTHGGINSEQVDVSSTSWRVLCKTRVCGRLKIACLFCVLLLALHVLSIRNTFYFN